MVVAPLLVFNVSAVSVVVVDEEEEQKKEAASGPSALSAAWAISLLMPNSRSSSCVVVS